MMGYLDSFVPSASGMYKTVKTTWAGLNRRQTQDTGELSEARNISLRKYPSLSTEKASSIVWRPQSIDEVVRSVHDTGGGSFAVITYDTANGVLNFYYIDGNKQFLYDAIYTPAEGEKIPDVSVSVFNKYDDKDNNLITASYRRMILIFPFCYSYDPVEDTVASFDIEGNRVPHLADTTVLQGRLWGVLDGKFFASQWNDYTGWALNTAEDDDSSLAWVSTTQSEVDASGDFTAITVYDGRVVGFKRNFMHQIYNNKTPFRIVDIARVGALSKEAVCECNQILFFVADDGVYAYTGGYPTRISDPLAVSDYRGAVLGADERTLFCYLPSEGTVFTYDTEFGAWGGISPVTYVPSSCATVNGVCMFASGNVVCRYRGAGYGFFSFETDSIFMGDLAEKVYSKLRLQASHSDHREGDFLTVSVISAPKGKTVVAKTVYPTKDGDLTLSCLLRGLCGLGHRIAVSGKGHFEIGYLRIDYKEGGKRYD